MTKNPNPLKQYFRQPVIYLKLPSRGQHWPAGSLDLPETGELPVYPMTAIDEITYRTPDALFNGSAVISVIESCVPAIKDAWSAPSSDINAILVAIRIASYGHGMDLNAVCPSCNENNEITVDLRVLLENIKLADFSETFRYGDLEIAFQPIDYRQANRTSQEQFEHQRQLQGINVSDLSEQEKIQKLNEALQNITKLTINALKWSITSIKTPTAMVTERDHIEEFINNCDRSLFNRIKDAIVELRQKSELPPIEIDCSHCSHHYTNTVSMDQASFFEPAS